MTTQILYLFLDTNVFIQCRPLKELNWSELGNYSEIHLIVPSPVYREIDSQKNRGNDRVGQRARATYTSFRDIAMGVRDYELIRETAPRVTLLLESPSKPSTELSNRLDYSKPDDEIIGCMYRFKQDNPDKDVQLLTHDTGPMLTAKSLDLPTIPVNDSWILPHENNPTERENEQLKNELKRLRNTEPAFQIRCVDGQGSDTDSLDFEYLVYDPLTDNEVSGLIDELSTQYPVGTHFGPREPGERVQPGLSQILNGRTIFIPASDEAIAEYTDQKYPAWIKECEKVLSTLHEALQRNAEQPSFRFVAENYGTRPGTDALVEIEGKGNFKICPPPREDREDSGDEVEKGLRLPMPPQPPQGQWAGTLFASEVLRNSLSRFLNNRSDPIPQPFFLDNMQNQRRDPNAFYYKPNRPTIPSESFSLECEQWRHGISEECFDGQIFFRRATEEIRGELLCEIHAENLSTPVKKVIRVNITLNRTNLVDHARTLISSLTK